jgi:membrane protease YdiL (CAAX protease family)
LSNPLLLQAASALISIALLAISATVFWRVIVRLRREGGNVRSAGFQIPDALVALVLISFFSVMLISALSRRTDGEAPLTVDRLLPDSIGFIVFTVGIASYLKFLRGMSLLAMFGLTRLSTLKILGWAVGLLICASPLIGEAAILSRAALPKEDVVPQPLVELFRDVAHHADYPALAKLLIAIVVVAPICEEFLFRGFYYGVGKRFLGPVPAGFLTAMLFAASHLNLAGLASLFVLAVCFTLAYERTGSLLVPICMHALFNFTNLFFIFGQAQGWFPMQ